MNEKITFDINSEGLSAEKISLINRILKNCIKFDVFKSEDELDNLFDLLSLLDLNHLNQILDDESYKNGIDALIQFCNENKSKL